jgi:hypothetical protein
MKTYVLTVFLFLVSAGFLFAQNFPTSGRWKLQVIGTQEEFFIEINNTTWTFESSGSSVPQIVTVDNRRKTIIIPLLAALSDRFVFEIKREYIDLRAGGTFNIPLLEVMRNGMTGMEGINEVTDDFIEALLVEIEAAFYKVPIMRLYRVN